MKQLTQGCLLVGWLLFAAGTSAQNMMDDLLQTQKTLTQIKQCVKANYVLYQSAKPQAKELENIEATLYLNGDVYAYKSKEMETLTNTKMTLSIDHFQQVVLINKYNPAESKQLLKEVTALLTDSLRKAWIKDTLIKSDSFTRVWRLQYLLPSAELNRIEITLSVKDYALNKMVYYYNRTFEQLYGEVPEGIFATDKPRLEIVLTNYRPITPQEEVVFTGEDIVKMDAKGKATLVSKYKNYTLSNYYNAKP